MYTKIPKPGKACRDYSWEHLPGQLLLRMKITALVIFVTCLQVSAHEGFSQMITYSGKNVPLEIVFKSIEKQTGLSFFFNMALVHDARVSVTLNSVSLDDALHEVLKGQELDYYMAGRTIFIVKKKIAGSTMTGAIVTGPADPEPSVKGIVTNQQGEPLVGATVSVKNRGRATLTDEKGGFELKNVQKGAILEITYLGYQKKEIGIKEGGMLRVELAPANSKLDEVQVIAYGNTTERFNTGNITTVNGEDIRKQSVINPLIALEGRVSGLFVTQSSGVPGSGTTARIQGQNSIINGNDPLYVIDGIPYASQLLSNLGSVLGGSGGANGTAYGNPLSFINPSEIESISVLKDADATAIYGSRAANGAILITTRKGKAGETRFDLNAQYGVGQITRKLHLLNTQQYLEMRHEAIRNDNLTPNPSFDFDLTLWDTTRYTDWQKELIGNLAHYSNYNVSISGGSANTQYMVNGTFRRETTVFPGDFSDQRGAVYFNLNNSSADQRFKMQFSGSYLIDNNQLPRIDLTNTAVTLAPDAPKVYNDDGSLNWALTSGASSWTNPLAPLYNKYLNKTNNLFSSALMSYKIYKGISITANFGYTNLQSNETAINPLLSTAPELRSTILRTASYGNNNINSWIVEPQALYKGIIGGGRLEGLVGMSIQQINGNGQQLLGSGYNSDLALYDIKSAPTVKVNSTTSSTYKYNAVFGRINYIWRERYVANFTARRDGSSRFGQENQFHNFGSVGAAWIFSQEDLFRNSFPFLSFGKISASYGTTGNDQIQDYKFMSLYNPTTVTGTPYQGVTGLTPNGLANPYLEWEQTRKIQAALSIGLLKDRILFNVNYFSNRSSNQLLNYSLPIITGFFTIARNFPATVQNSGFEFSMNTTNIRSKSFTWTTSLNLTIPQNKLVSFPNIATSPYSSSYVIGMPITIIKAFHLIGVDPKTGIYQFSDNKGNPTINPSQTTDKMMVTNTAPRFFGGFQSNFTYKSIQLDFLLQIVKQKGPSYFFGYYPGAMGINQPVSVLNRWQKTGDIAPIQRYNSDYGLLVQQANTASSDAYYGDASFVRLKSFNISWQLLSSWKKAMHIKDCRIYFHGENLLTITNYKGLDPENMSFSSLPPLRQFLMGLQISL